MSSEVPELGPLAAFTVGEGAASTVLLHGFLGSGRNLRSLAMGWWKRQPARRFLLPDLTGHGESPPLPPKGTLDDMAKDVLETAARAGFTAPLEIVGHSLGGRVALAAARVAPERIGRVVLLDIAPGPIDPVKSDSRRVLDVMLQAPDVVTDRRELRAFFIERGLTPALADWVLMNVRPDGDMYRWRIDRHAMDALHDTFNREDLWPVVGAGQVPIRCIRGGRARYVSDDDLARLQSLGADAATLADAGHYVHIDALEPLLDWLCS